ncbi:hypothetical protein C0Q70_09385 [Pomacea canaliculata]|uniref:Uncharacterized protein n=1 Tax=Pomacea canaliculata TaxID=400727 RepID=A0A2T7P9N2_POMCA|nr:hypothetical protein C0Q70_09385 [Pomacea canaliculata]
MQQDPRTGLVQLVPISVMSHSCSHSQPTTPCSACTPNSESGLVQGLQHQFFHVSPNTVPLLDAPSVDLSGQDSGKGKDEVSSNRFMTTNSRSAKGLVHKTAAQHTKHCAKPHCTTDFLDKESFAISDSPTGFGIGHGRVNNSGSGVPSRNSGSYTVQDQGSRGSSRQMYVHDEAIVRSHHDSDRAQDDGKPQHTSSHLQPLTPPLKGGDVSSPDKLTTFQGAEVGLMDGMQYGNNLQHNAAYTQVQQTLQDGGIIVGPVPDKEVMTDYVLSLAHLTWETFKNAVLEKYPHIQWQNNLLARLFHVVNGDWPPADRDPAKTLPVEGRKAFINEEQNTLGKKTKLYSGQLDSLPSAPKGKRS